MRSKDNKQKCPDVMHVTPKGRKIKLVWENEYRAYEFDEQKETWSPMRLGSASADNLLKHIDEKEDF